MLSRKVLSLTKPKGIKRNPGKGEAPYSTPWCSSYQKREPSGHPRLRSPTLLIYKVFLFNWNDLRIVVWFQVFPSNINLVSKEMYSYGSPHMAAQKQDDQLERTFSSYVRIQDVVLKTYLGRWTIGRSGERGSGISVLPARYDDDDDLIIICLPPVI